MMYVGAVRIPLPPGKQHHEYLHIISKGKAERMVFQ
jgi:hypothetical protein